VIRASTTVQYSTQLGRTPYTQHLL